MQSRSTSSISALPLIDLTGPTFPRGRQTENEPPFDSLLEVCAPPAAEGFRSEDSGPPAQHPHKSETIHSQTNGLNNTHEPSYTPEPKDADEAATNAELIEEPAVPDGANEGSDAVSAGEAAAASDEPDLEEPTEDEPRSADVLLASLAALDAATAQPVSAEENADEEVAAISGDRLADNGIAPAALPASTTGAASGAEAAGNTAAPVDLLNATLVAGDPVAAVEAGDPATPELTPDAKLATAGATASLAASSTITSAAAVETEAADTPTANGAATENPAPLDDVLASNDDSAANEESTEEADTEVADEPALNVQTEQTTTAEPLAESFRPPEAPSPLPSQSTDRGNNMPRDSGGANPLAAIPSDVSVIRQRLPAEILGGTSASSPRPTPELGVDSVRLLQRVARAFAAAHERGGDIRLRLSPAELGAVRLEVQVRDGAMVARVEAETSAARTAIIESLPILRERLAEQGLRIERFEVDLMNRQGSGSPENPAHRNAEPAIEERRPPRTVSSREAPAPQPRTAVPSLTPGRLNVVV